MVCLQAVATGSHSRSTPFHLANRRWAQEGWTNLNLSLSVFMFGFVLEPRRVCEKLYLRHMAHGGVFCVFFLSLNRAVLFQWYTRVLQVAQRFYLSFLSNLIYRFTIMEKKQYR